MKKDHLLGVLVLLLFACGGDDLLPPAPPPPPLSQALAIVSGNSQQGTTGEFLAEPFVVRVTNPQGTGVSSVPVTWTVVSGAGGFGLPSSITPTAADGVASMSFRPTTPGTITVNAKADGVQGSPATFTVDVIGPVPPVVVLIRFGPLFDCYGAPSPQDPSIFEGPEGTIPVGALVEWEYADWLPPVCGAQLRSVSVPPGGLPFDSGIIRPGQRWGVVLEAAGDWLVTDVLNGGSVTLRVQ